MRQSCIKVARNNWACLSSAPPGRLAFHQLLATVVSKSTAIFSADAIFCWARFATKFIAALLAFQFATKENFCLPIFTHVRAGRQFRGSVQQVRPWHFIGKNNIEKYAALASASSNDGGFGPTIRGTVICKAKHWQYNACIW